MKIFSACLSMAAFFLALIAHAQETLPDVEAGVDRWKIKTSMIAHPTHHTVDLKDLLALKNPIVAADKGKFDTKRIKTTVGGNLHLKEGDLITTTGWLWLVALEDASDTHRDGDYHIQIRPFESWGDSCLIVEVPYKSFASGANLKSKCDDVRAFIRSHFLRDHEPSKAGSVLPHSVKVTVTGQLFFDAIHINTAPRGKQGMKSYTCWELHPIIEMKLAN